MIWRFCWKQAKNMKTNINNNSTKYTISFWLPLFGLRVKDFTIPSIFLTSGCLFFVFLSFAHFKRQTKKKKERKRDRETSLIVVWIAREITCVEWNATATATATTKTPATAVLPTADNDLNCTRCYSENWN